MDTDAVASAKTRGLLAFRIGDVDFGARVEEVAGLVEADRLAPLPGGREPVAGLVAFRGAIVVAIDLASYLGEPSLAASPRWALILARGVDRFALVIPSLPRLIPGSSLPAPERPDDSDTEANALVESIYRHEGAPIHCLRYWSAFDLAKGAAA